MELKEQPRKVKINPHVEAHGNYSMEWSYHFPLNPGYRIESELKISFPREKIPGSARHALSEANLSHTRLSLADIALNVRTDALLFLRDSRWLKHNIRNLRQDGVSQTAIENITSAFFVRVQGYWAHTFFSRIGLLLMSDLKQSAHRIRSLLRDAINGSAFDWPSYRDIKRSLMADLRSASRIVETRKIWEQLFENEQLVHLTSQDFSGHFHVEPKKFLADLIELSEFSLILLCKSIADIQILIQELEQTLQGNEKHELLLTRFKQEQEWYNEWVRQANSLREDCKLPSLQQIASDQNAAIGYFERMRELQRKHYHAWDLEVNMHPNEARYTFIITSMAAAISATFAFVATLTFGLFQSKEALSIQTQSTIALTTFAVGNMIIYAVKDSLKEWLRIRFKKTFHSGRWMGNCVLQMRSDHDNDVTEQIEVANMARETWWTKTETAWDFHLWEEFRITPVARNAGARIIKQVWKLPLDEILHSLDDAVHHLKLPAIDGRPQEVPVLKRSVFPYQLTVVVRGWKNKRPTVVDFAHIEGKIITAGRKIFVVE